MKIFLPLSLAVVLLVLNACHPNRHITDTSKLEKVMELYKSPCFGYCPVFKFTIYNNRLATYKGIANVDKLGYHHRFLSKKQYKNICRQFKKANLWQYADNYPSDIQDIPMTTITYWQKGSEKKLIGDINRPPAVKALALQMDSLSQIGDWIAEQPDTQQLQVIKHQILLTFSEGVDIALWVHRYTDYNLQLVRRIKEDDLHWLIRYDSSKIEPEKMLQLIQNSDEVKQAEFNRAMSNSSMNDK